VLIKLPGSLRNADIFYLQLRHLASQARCIAIDYPGAQTAALADGLAAIPRNLLGSSLGRYWLQTFGSRHHRRIKSLILASTFRGSHDLRNHPPQQPFDTTDVRTRITRHKRADDAYE
jgi:pimeloyl-ACP methyl ester carboxylesterase